MPVRPGDPFPDKLPEQLVSNIQGGVIICQYDPPTATSRVLYASEGWTKLTGYTIDDINEHFGGSPQALILPEDVDLASHSYAEQVSQGNFYELQYRFRHKNGAILWAIDRGVVSPMSEGKSQNQSILTDITPMKESEEKLRLSETRFRIATKASRAAVFEFDLQNNRYVHIENAESVFQLPASDIIQAMERLRAQSPQLSRENVFCHWYHPDDVPTLLHAIDEMQQHGSSECEVRLRQPNGGYLWCMLYQALVGPQTMDSPFHSIGYMVNNDRQHKQTERLLREAQSDPLTGLLNKNASRMAIEQLLCEHPTQSHALLVLDVDNFKGVNDSLGHLFGDAVLMETSSKLRRLFRHDSFVGRIGGDEFLVLVRGKLTPAQAAERATELCRLFRHTYTGEKADYSVSCSVGVALSEPGDTYDSLFAKADAALYQAKADGKDRFILYSRDLSTKKPQVRPIDPPRRPEGSDSGRLALKERIFELLYSSMDFSSSVNMILALLGAHLEASRVYIFETPANDPFVHLIYEWCADGTDSLLPDIQNLSLSEMDYFSLFDEHDVFCHLDLKHLDHPIRELFLKHQACATFQVIMRENGRLCGFIGYDRKQELEQLTDEHADLMSFAAKLTATFILKKWAEDQVRQHNQNKMAALDRLPCPIYVIDEDYRLHYANDILLATQPSLQIGMRCHHFFQGLDHPCDNCPAMDCQNGPCSQYLYNHKLGLHLIASASTISWSDQANMRLICCQVIERNR